MTRKLVLAGLGQNAESPAAMELAMQYLSDPALAPTAGLATLRIAHQLRNSHTEAARAALDQVLEKVNHDDVRRRAQEVVNDMEKFADHILQWEGVGPFMEEGKDGAAIYQMVFDPERPDAKDVKWKLVTKGIGTWDINLEAEFGGFDHCAAYLRTRVWSRSAQEALMEMGSDDAVKTWLNGQLVFDKWTVQGSAPRQHQVKVSLKQGWNDLMLKAVDFEGGWVVACRLRAPDGSSLEGVEITARPRLKAASRRRTIGSDYPGQPNHIPAPVTPVAGLLPPPPTITPTMNTIKHTSLAILLTITLLRIATAEEPPIDPVPRAVKSQVLHTWDFQQGTEGWAAESQCSLAARDGVLRIQSTGGDPYFHLPVDLPGGQVVLELKVRSSVGTAGSVFWTTDQQPRRGEDKRSDFEIPDNGQWLVTRTRFTAPGQLTDLRIDPGTKPGLIEIDSIQVIHEQLHPLSVSRITQTKDAVQFEVINHQDTPVTFTSDAKEYTLPGTQETYDHQEHCRQTTTGACLGDATVRRLAAGAAHRLGGEPSCGHAVARKILRHGNAFRGS